MFVRFRLIPKYLHSLRAEKVHPKKIILSEQLSTGNSQSVPMWLSCLMKTQASPGTRIPRDIQQG